MHCILQSRSTRLVHPCMPCRCAVSDSASLGGEDDEHQLCWPDDGLTAVSRETMLRIEAARGRPPRRRGVHLRKREMFVSRAVVDPRPG